MSDDLQGLGSETTIFRIEPDWSGPVGFERELNQQINGFPNTVQEVLSWTSRLPNMINFKLTSLSKEEEYEVIEFFNDRKGRLSPFWLPSNVKEFELSQTIPLGATDLYVYDNGFANVYQGYERVFLDMANGDLITRKITSVSEGPGADELTLHLDTVTDREIAPSSVRKFGKLMFVRFAKDVIDNQHDAKFISSLTVSFQELVREYPA